MTILASLTGQVTSWIGDYGVYAVFAIMAVDALLPVGGELTMLYAGTLAAGAVAGAHPALFGIRLAPGLESYLVLAIAGAVGYLVGSLVGWAIGVWGGHALLERHGRWLHLGPERLARAERWFDRFGRWAVFLGRITPLVRSFISIPAGALGSPLGRYTVLTLAGSLLWCFAFAAAGWALGGSYDRVHQAFRYVDYAVVALVVLAVGALVGRWLRARQRARQ
jgi:membrane protein DedA with SNARE-associated domain